MNYSDCIKELEKLEKFGINLGTQRIEYLLSKLNSPHKSIKVVLVGGTNGKGSVVAILSSIFSNSGYKVGMYTSPHLLEYTERIQINGKSISNDIFVDAFSEVEKHITDCKNKVGQPTIFEVLTAMAYFIFAEEKVDIAVFEVGLGGRFDAVNVVSPLVSAITTIGLDHTEVLGNTLEKIAYEKAGILRQDVPVVIAPQEISVLDVISSVSRNNKSSVTLVRDRDSEVNLDGAKYVDILSYRKDGYGEKINLRGKREYKDLFIPLFGYHQVINTAVAIAILEELLAFGFEFSAEKIRSSLSKTVWQGRFEIAKENPLIILDSAHNPSGALALKNSLERFGVPKPITLILGIQEYKDIKAIIDILSPLAQKIIATCSTHKRAASPSSIAKKLQEKKNIKVTISSTVNDAINQALKSGKEQTICITGSIFTVADALKYLKP